MFDPFPQPLAVVPIFVNAGSALLPAILAPIFSAAALLLRPRELCRACMRRPMVPILLIGAALAIWWAMAWLLGADAAASRTRARTPFASATPRPRSPLPGGHLTWEDYARHLIRQQEAGAAIEAPATAPAAAAQLIFRYDASRCGHDRGPAPLDLRPFWTASPDPDAMYISSPLVVGDRVFVASAMMDGDSFGGLFCLNARDGSKIWELTRFEDGEPLKAFFSSPALSDDGKHILIGQGLHYDTDSHLLCVDAAGGTLKWSIKTPLHIEGSPAVHGDTVIAGAGAIEGNDKKPTGHGGFVLAARISDGKELWRHDLADPESSPAISKDGSIVYIGSGFQGNAVVALRTESDEQLKSKGLSRQLWCTPVPYPATGAVTLIDDLVIVGAGRGDFVDADPRPAGIVVALDAKTGTQRWARELPDAVLGAAAARDGKLICPVRSGEVVALNLSDGSILWRRAISGSAPILAGPAFTGSHVYAVSADGYLAILDASDGSFIGPRHRLNAEGKAPKQRISLSSPLISGGRLYVGSETGGVHCFVGGKLAP
jgi:outer membrane protein assembly factor BamB